MAARSRTRFATAYPCTEAAGVVFAYMGPRTHPLCANYEWMTLPQNHLYVTSPSRLQLPGEGLEGECDSSHLSFLHRALRRRKRGGGDPDMYGRDGAPKLEGVETDFGVRMISCRNAGDGINYLRVSNFVMPCYGFVPTGGLKGNPEGYTIHSHVPADDEHALRFNIYFRRNRPVSEEEKQLEGGIGPTTSKFAISTTLLAGPKEQRRDLYRNGKAISDPRLLRHRKHGADLRPFQGHLGAGHYGDRREKVLLQSVRALDMQRTATLYGHPNKTIFATLPASWPKSMQPDPKAYIQNVIAR
jgi:hypothetical protein